MLPSAPCARRHARRTREVFDVMIVPSTPLPRRDDARHRARHRDVSRHHDDHRCTHYRDSHRDDARRDDIRHRGIRRGNRRDDARESHHMVVWLVRRSCPCSSLSWPRAATVRRSRGDSVVALRGGPRGDCLRLADSRASPTVFAGLWSEPPPPGVLWITPTVRLSTFRRFGTPLGAVVHMRPRPSTGLSTTTGRKGCISGIPAPTMGAVAHPRSRGRNDCCSQRDTREK